MKKILITGGTKFVSKYAAQYFSEQHYEVYVLNRNTKPQIQGVTLIEGDRHELGDALVATVKKRGTLGQIEAEDIDEVFDEIQSSPVMENLWKAYQRNFSYADDLSWHTVMDAIRVLYQTVYAERNGTHD